MTVYNVTLEQFAEAVRNIPKEGEQAVIRGLRSTARICQRYTVEEIRRAQPYAPVDRGELANSVDTATIETGAITHVDAPHAPFIEFGTRPHWAPLEALTEWVRRKGIVGKRRKSETRSEAARRGWETRRRRAAGLPDYDEAEIQKVAKLIQYKIAHHGTKPRHFMKKAYERAVERMRREVLKELRTAGIPRGRGGKR